MTNRPFPKIDRRQLLIGAGGLALAGAVPAGLAASSGFVVFESGALRKVLVHQPTWADFSGSGLLAGADPFWLEAAEEMVAKHAELACNIEATGAQVLHLEDLLESAVDEARRRGVWGSWLGSTFPELAGRETTGAATLLGRGEQAGTDMHGLFHLGDFAVMLPHGLMLCNGAGSRRQADLFRFIFAFAPELRDYPVVLDAREQGLRVSGRDILVHDRRTLLVGTGGNPRIGAALARRTGMDVITVDLAVAQFAPDAHALTLVLERA